MDVVMNMLQFESSASETRLLFDNSTTGDEYDRVTRGTESVWLVIIWMSLFICFFVWCASAIHSYYSERGIVQPTDQDEAQETKKKQAIAYFESKRKQMVCTVVQIHDSLCNIASLLNL